MKPRRARDQCHACLGWYRADFLESDPNDRERLLCDACLAASEAESAKADRAIALQAKRLRRQKKS